MASNRDRYNRSRDVRRDTPQKPDLGIEITDLNYSDINQTTAPDIGPTPSFYNVKRGTSTTSGDLTVPLKFPNRDEMAVHMVPYGLVNSLEEQRSDEDTISGFFWTLLGALLGVTLSWLPDIGISDIPVYVHFIRLTMIILLVIFSIFVGLYWKHLIKRINSVKSELNSYQY